ncbi:MAG: BrnT family toxin [Deltaproteobacteria bacterium]|nr:BrnT family toxin [Deltaproteobacteria bacterium]
MTDYIFEWDNNKEIKNMGKHGFSFKEATEVFKDPQIVHFEDLAHSSEENRYYAVGKIRNGIVLTVRYTQEGNTIRIFGAAVWRKWRKFYEKRKNTESL